jgi:hypothetical protein
MASQHRGQLVGFWNRYRHPVEAEADPAILSRPARASSRWEPVFMEMITVAGKLAARFDTQRGSITT